VHTKRPDTEALEGAKAPSYRSAACTLGELADVDNAIDADGGGWDFDPGRGEFI